MIISRKALNKIIILERSGIGLIGVLLLLSILSLIGTTLVMITKSQVEATVLGNAMVQAKLLAESGMEHALILASLFPEIIEDYAHISKGATVEEIRPIISAYHPFSQNDIIGDNNSMDPWKGSFQFFAAQDELQEVTVKLAEDTSIAQIVIFLDNDPLSLTELKISTKSDEEGIERLWAEYKIEDLEKMGDIIRLTKDEQRVKYIMVDFGPQQEKPVMIHEICAFKKKKPITFEMKGANTGYRSLFSYNFVHDTIISTGRIFQDNETIAGASVQARIKLGRLNLFVEQIDRNYNELLPVGPEHFKDGGAIFPLDPSKIDRELVELLIP